MPSAPPPLLHTDRLLLRGWRESDVAPFAAMNADPRVTEFFADAQDAAATATFVERIGVSFAERGYGLWALERLDTGEFIGFTGLWTLPEGSPSPGGVEVGWRLAPSAWGRGFATEAASASLADGIRRLGLSDVWSWAVASNTASTAVMKRLGMTLRWEGPNPKVPAGHRLSETVGYHLDGATWRAES
ncbi:GNAT family N-acetyltransferase [Knoellia subterranea]|uniref:GCN5 family N-acetyltransferase n=1 Tax=Knoellia subterranea KCTC 19937 TaxID=1385521 RepID=A0A0A0JM24_9MICO|nr:GNAT family N-acetyltransferase [Knoellia subterranea]KGN36691.1 GCN5 family N-acetyltransferase [Knoellia subterranea KCTC 19937]